MVILQDTSRASTLWIASATLLFGFWATPLLLPLLPMPDIIEDVIGLFPNSSNSKPVFFLVPSVGALLLLSGYRLGKYLLGPWLVFFTLGIFAMIFTSCNDILIERRMFKYYVDTEILTMGLIVVLGACLHLAALLSRVPLASFTTSKRTYRLCTSIATATWGLMSILAIIEWLLDASLVELTGARSPIFLICFVAYRAALGVARGGENQRYFLGLFLYFPLEMLSDCLFAQEVDYRWWTPCIILYTTCIVSTLMLIASRPAAESDSPKQIRIPAEVTP